MVRLAVQSAAAALVALCVLVVPAPSHAVGISVVSDDGAWSWFSDPRAICDGNVVYAGWVTTLGDIQVGTHDVLDGTTWISELEQEFGPDDHDYPALYQTTDGRYTAFYSGHAVRWTHNLYRVARYAYDISTWDDRDSTGVNTEGIAGVTYSNPYTIPGETDQIYLFWRGGYWKPTYATGTYDPVLKEWDWEFQGQLITVYVGRPYVKYAQGEDKIGFAFTDTHPSQALNNIYYAAIELDDLGEAGYFRADGTLIKHLDEGPLEPVEADTIFRRLADPGTTGDNSWIWDIAFDDQGNPVVTFATFLSKMHHQYHWARYNGYDWDDEIVVENAGGSVADTTIGSPQYYYSGGIAVDPVDTSITYVSVENELGGWDIERRERISERCWEATPITVGETVDNMRPVVPRARPPHVEMVLWMSGRYDYYLNGVEFPPPPMADSLDYRNRAPSHDQAPLRSRSRTDTLYYDTEILCWSHDVTTDVPGDVPLAGVKLFPNRPNPFSESTEVAYALGEGSDVRLAVYDVAGREVRTLFRREMPAGRHRVLWDGRDESGHRAASGVYFLKLEAAGRVETRRAVLVR